MSKKTKGFVQRIKQRLKLKKTVSCPDNEQLSGAPQVIPRQQHIISRNNLSKNALKVMYRLKESNFQAFLVGGGVRDCLLDRKPKDFDVATDATPEEVRDIFRNSRIIGRRFRLVHVFFRDEVIEVSTFRSNSSEVDQDEDDSPPMMITRDNIYGTIEEDAWRRDFTVNALYYNIADFSVVDYTDGMRDLEKRQIRMIGDPVQRFHEDPVRLLRAIRLAAKLDFSIEAKTEATLVKLGYLLEHVPLARLLDEVTKLFFEGYALVTYELLERKNYIKVLFPTVYQIVEIDPTAGKLVHAALKATDDRFHNQQRLTPSYLLAVMLWPVLQQQLQNKTAQGERFAIAFHQAMHDTLNQKSVLCLITKRMRAMMQSMWTMQFHLERRRPRRLHHLVNHRYFRAAYDLLHLRASVGLVSEELANWWLQFQLAKPKERRDLIKELGK